MTDFGHDVLAYKLRDGLHFVVLLHPFVSNTDITNNIDGTARVDRPLARYRNLLTYQKKTWIEPKRYNPEVNAEEWIMQGNPDRLLLASGRFPEKLPPPSYFPKFIDFTEGDETAREEFLDRQARRISDHRARIRRHFSVAPNGVTLNGNGEEVEPPLNLDIYYRKLCQEYRRTIKGAAPQIAAGREIDQSFLTERQNEKIGEVLAPGLRLVRQRQLGEFIMELLADPTVLPNLPVEDRKRMATQYWHIARLTNPRVNARDAVIFVQAMTPQARNAAVAALPARFHSEPHFYSAPERLFPVDARFPTIAAPM